MHGFANTVEAERVETRVMKSSEVQLQCNVCVRISCSNICDND